MTEFFKHEKKACMHGPGSGLSGCIYGILPSVSRCHHHDGVMHDASCGFKRGPHFFNGLLLMETSSKCCDSPDWLVGGWVPDY